MEGASTDANGRAVIVTLSTNTIQAPASWSSACIHTMNRLAIQLQRTRILEVLGCSRHFVAFAKLLHLFQ